MKRVRWVSARRSVLPALVASLLLTLLVEPRSAAAADPTMSCEPGPTSLALEIGSGFPLPRSLSNPTSNRLRLSVTMTANRFFGPAREVLAVTLDAGLGRTQSASPIVPTSVSTPLGRGTLSLELRADKTGDRVFKRCVYELDLQRGEAHARLIQVPIVWCAFEGGRTAGPIAPGLTVAADRLAMLIDRVNETVWVPQAEIAFTRPPGLPSVPVVADTMVPPGGSRGVFEGGIATDLEVLGRDCLLAWQGIRSGTVALPIIGAREILGPAEGAAIGYSTVTFGLNASRYDDLCTVPRKLTSADVQNQAVIVEDTKGDSALLQIVAHELGHALYLSHGNGLDDNGDGLDPPAAGIRRFDNPCDPLRTDSNTSPNEDAQTPGTDCAATRTLMYFTTTLCQTLRPLQVELARSIARLYPGARVPPLIRLPPWLIPMLVALGGLGVVFVRRKTR